MFNNMRTCIGRAGTLRDRGGLRPTLRDVPTCYGELFRHPRKAYSVRCLLLSGPPVSGPKAPALPVSGSPKP